MDEQACEERQKACEKRMDSQAEDVKTIFSIMVSWRVFVIAFGALFALITGSYGYTVKVSDRVDSVIERMDDNTHDIIEAIKAIK